MLSSHGYFNGSNLVVQVWTLVSCFKALMMLSVMSAQVLNWKGLRKGTSTGNCLISQNSRSGRSSRLHGYRCEAQRKKHSYVFNLQKQPHEWSSSEAKHKFVVQSGDSTEFRVMNSVFEGGLLRLHVEAAALHEALKEQYAAASTNYGQPLPQSQR